MKKNFTTLNLAMLLFLTQASAHAASGSLFNVTASGTPATISITLCLNATAELSCQTYTVSALNLNISTVIANHPYLNAGIKVNTPGYAPDFGCTPIANGFCTFSANNTSPTNVIVVQTTNADSITFGGFYFNGSHDVPFSYLSNNSGSTWNGNSPLPTLPAGGVSGTIARVSCDSSKSICSGVGSYNNASTNLPLAYTSTNGGISWTISSTLPPLAPGATASILNDVRCNSTGSACRAVGYYSNGINSFPVTYTSSNGGKAWTLSSPLPTLPGGGTNGSLEAISCNTTGTTCTAVGSYNNGTFIAPLVYTSSNGGSSWTLSSPLPLIPANAPGHANVLLGISCNSTESKCSAIGFHYNGTVDYPLTYTSSNGGSTWTLSSPQPTIQPGSTSSNLTSLSCDSAGLLCESVGSYTNGSNTFPLSYVSNNGGSTWTISTTLPPMPVGAVNALLSVTSCNSAGVLCAAGGFYYNGAATFPLTYTSNNSGVTWSLSTTQPILPPGGTNGVIGSGVG